MKIKILYLILATTVVLCACRSTPDEIPVDLQPREFFQKAQEAVVERNDYDTALFYYQTFLDRYPDDIQRSVEAEYEIAFIHYKQNDMDTAVSLFENLLARYEGEGSEVLPQWPKTLTIKILEKIKATTAEE